MMRLIGCQMVDYFSLLCETCRHPTENEYLGGQDVGAPRFRATCKTCNSSTILKFDAPLWRNLPSQVEKH